jgi:glycosyltransferase involved in cell wall biosynthesis
MPEPALSFRPYAHEHDLPRRRSVAVTAIVLALNEEKHVKRCLDSLEWCDQVLVVDAGSVDRTVEIATDADRDVVVHPWPGFAAQRQWALTNDAVRNPWIYFVDADEWTSAALAREVEQRITDRSVHAYEQRFRTIFLGTWIRHCGWYGGSFITRLLRTGAGTYATAADLGERVSVDGKIGRLRHDLVDEDIEGVARWLRKHAAYAVLEAERRVGRGDLATRWQAVRRLRGRSFVRRAAKDLVFPAIPAKPAALFFYMYVLRAGFLDGVAGLTFCALHASHELAIGAAVRQHRLRAAGA